jgi:SRSO17 transposase
VSSFKGECPGFEKRGACSAGVQRQYVGTAGKITNYQVGVFLGYASSRGRAMVDRELYLPHESWINEPGRCVAAQIPAHVGFATKPQLLRTMIERAITAGLAVRLGAPTKLTTTTGHYGASGNNQTKR